MRLDGPFRLTSKTCRWFNDLGLVVRILRKSVSQIERIVQVFDQLHGLTRHTSAILVVVSQSIDALGWTNAH